MFREIYSTSPTDAGVREIENSELGPKMQKFPVNSRRTGNLHTETRSLVTATITTHSLDIERFSSLSRISVWCAVFRGLAEV